MTWKTILLVVVITVVLIGGIAGALYKQKLTQAELTNNALIERAQKLSREKIAIQKKFDLLGKVSTLRISTLQTQITEKDRASQAILTLKSAEIKKLRFTAGSWEEKYNRLEPECLQLSAKVAAQNETIGLLKLTINEMENLDSVRVENINELTGKLTECQSLLDISIKNTKSILRRSWVLKIFDRLSIVAGAGIGADGVARPCIAGGVRLI